MLNLHILIFLLHLLLVLVYNLVNVRCRFSNRISNVHAVKRHCRLCCCHIFIHSRISVVECTKITLVDLIFNFLILLFLLLSLDFLLLLDYLPLFFLLDFLFPRLLLLYVQLTIVVVTRVLFLELVRLEVVVIHCLAGTFAGLPRLWKWSFETFFGYIKQIWIFVDIHS